MHYSIPKATLYAELADRRKRRDFVSLAMVVRMRNAKKGDFQQFIRELES